MARPVRPPMMLVAVALALLAVLGFAVFRWSRFNTVHVVSGLAVPVVVKVAGQTLTIPANGRGAFDEVPTGTHVIETTVADGTRVETVLAFVTGGNHVVVYNVGGTAQLVWQRIAYTRNATDLQKPELEVHCGVRFVDHEDVDYVFTAPPGSISTKGGGTIYKTLLSLEEGGLKACEAWAADKGSQAMWSDWQRLQARLDPMLGLQAAQELARQGDYRGAQVLLERAMAKQGLPGLERMYQQLLWASGQGEKARARWAKDAADPGATEAEVALTSFNLRTAERLGYLEAALTRLPDSARLLTLKAQTLDRQGDTVSALATYDLARSKGGGGDPRTFYGYISALLRAGRFDDAWSKGAPRYRSEATIDAAIAWARLARATGHDITGWHASLKPFQRRWGQALLNLPVSPIVNRDQMDQDPEAFRLARQLIASAQVHPRRALDQVIKSKDAELRLMPAAVVWLLLTEAWRLGDGAAALRLAQHAGGLEAPRIDGALRFIVGGELDPQLDGCSDELLAVLWFARGRRLASLGETAQPAFDEARRLDAFRGVVSQAFAWPEVMAPVSGTKNMRIDEDGVVHADANVPWVPLP